jgi:hypothetical protein
LLRRDLISDALCDRDVEHLDDVWHLKMTNCGMQRGIEPLQRTMLFSTSCRASGSTAASGCSTRTSLLNWMTHTCDRGGNDVFCVLARHLKLCDE